MQLFFRTFVADFTDAGLAVLDGFHRATADAGHAVGAEAAPCRTSVFHLDVIHRTKLFAKAAACTVFLGIELICFHVEAVEPFVDRAAEDFVFDGDFLCSQIAALQDVVTRFFDDALRCTDDAL